MHIQHWSWKLSINFQLKSTQNPPQTTQTLPDVFSAAASQSVTWNPTVGSSLSFSFRLYLLELAGLEFVLKLTERATAFNLFIFEIYFSLTITCENQFTYLKLWLFIRYKCPCTPIYFLHITLINFNYRLSLELFTVAKLQTHMTESFSVFEGKIFLSFFN